jgi:amino acid transporter
VESTIDSGDSSASPGLRARCLSFPETLAQSIANISPTLTPVVIVPLVFASAGNGTWVAYLFATLGLVFVGANINEFARRSATPGSLYSFVRRGLGTEAGFIAGWSLISAYTLSGVAVLSGTVNYASLLLDAAGLHLPPALLYGLGTVGVWLIAYRDVRLSTRVMLVLEFASMLLILVLGALVMQRRHAIIDAAQFDVARMSLTGVKAGLILAIYSFVGYERATTLGDEAHDPHVTIPRSVLLSALVSGAFFMVTAYIAIMGFAGLPGSLADSTAPFDELARGYGVAWFGMLISAGAVISLFACTLASINAAARILYSMSRQGIFHAHVGRAHARNQTPHLAVSLCALVTFAVPAWLVGAGLGVLDIFNDLSTIATYGFMLAYLLVALGAPAMLRRLGELSVASVLKAAGAVAFLVPPIIATVYPAPPPPADRFPGYFVGYVGAGLLWYLLQRRVRPQR